MVVVSLLTSQRARRKRGFSIPAALCLLVLMAGTAGPRAETFAARQVTGHPAGVGRTQLAQDTPAAPWFHGWYTRITGADGLRSVAVIGTSYSQSKNDRREDGSFPGYLAIIVGSGDEISIYEAFPQRTTFWSSRPVAHDGKQAEQGEGFQWHADGYGIISDELIDVAIPGKVRINATLSGRRPWHDRVPWLGPEGLAEFMPGIPLHWFVYSLGSDAYYTLDGLGGSGVHSEGSGIAHQESSWGQVFPPAWAWSQAVSLDNTRQLALAGGELELGRKGLTAWFVGFHSPRITWEFTPTHPNTVFSTRIDACAGSFRLVVLDSLRKLDINAVAPRASFVQTSIPTAEGYVPGGVESFSASVQVQAFLRTGPEREVLIDAFTFEGGALEFGNGYECAGAAHTQR